MGDTKPEKRTPVLERGVWVQPEECAHVRVIELTLIGSTTHESMRELVDISATSNLQEIVTGLLHNSRVLVGNNTEIMEDYRRILISHEKLIITQNRCFSKIRALQQEIDRIKAAKKGTAHERFKDANRIATKGDEVLSSFQRCETTS